jgi:hypothetical protein
MLVDYAEWRGELSQTHGSTTAHAHLVLAAKRGNVAAQRKLHGPPLPLSVRYLWDYVREVAEGIAVSGMGSLRVTWRDIESWAAMTGRVLSPMEARCVLAAGNAYFAAVSSREGR